MSEAPTAAGQVGVARLIGPGELTAEDRATWDALQVAHPELERPFFAADWFKVLDDAGHPVEIAVLASDGGTVAFLPFHRDGHAMRPPGGRLADFQGWVGAADLALDVPAVVRSVGARAWHFDHLLARQGASARHGFERAGSPLADLSGGFEAYESAHRARGAGWTAQVPRKARKLGREVGPLRFEMTSHDPEVLAQLRAWKRAQRLRTRTLDPFDDPWAERAVEACLESEGPAFGGLLSALWAGDQLVAAHLGLRSRGTLHVWFPAYDVTFEHHSPGMIMLHEMLRAAAEGGIGRVDFGKGQERYKASLMTGQEWLVEGRVDLRPIGRLVSGAAYRSRRWLRATGIAARLRGPKRRIRGMVRAIRGA